MTPPPVDPPRAILPTQPPVPAPATTHDPIDSDPLKTLELKPKLIEALSTVYDPEIPVNIYEMGLIYDVDVNADGLVGIRMTLTSPACPAAQSIPVEVEAKAKAVPGVSDAWVDVVWEPTWDMSKMSEAAKLQLGLL
ncbi:MAG: FeS assembly SUF system protein [Acidobacteria bacterium]|nr:FeS assembly SUF system protein [Acidobacteriota bacterium]